MAGNDRFAAEIRVKGRSPQPQNSILKYFAFLITDCEIIGDKIKGNGTT